MALLTVDHIRVEFGGIVALADLSFTIDEGQICALIGPNGAGKTTLFNCVSRLYQPERAASSSTATTCSHFPRTASRGAGIARTFQNLALFPALTVVENVMVGAHCAGRVVASARAPTRSSCSNASASPTSPITPPSGLPYGTLKRIEIARALAARPKLLLLDEPAAGLTHSEVDELGDLVRSIRDDFELTVLLVEHHMAMVMAISDKVVVLDFGSQDRRGRARRDPRRPACIEAYLGTPA